MPKIFGLIIFYIATVSQLIGQDITVLDKATSKPIADVVIYTIGDNQSAITNGSGKANMDQFAKNALLNFQHPSYQEFNISIQYLDGLKFIISLDEKITKYNEVVISANKWEQNATEVPQEILSITAEDIQFTNPQTAADLLKNTGQVFVQKSQLGGGSPTLRGFAANRVLIVVDGVRMNNAIFRSGNLQNIINIDPNALESTEVVFGPGSVIYGSDALGGVMDFHTLKPKFSNSDEVITEGKVMTRYASANNEKTGHINLKIGGKKLAFATAFSFSDFDDLKTGSNFDEDYPGFGKRPTYADRINGLDILVNNPDQSIQRNSGYRQWSAINKVRYRPNNNLEFSYGFYFANTSDIPRYDRLIRPSDDGLRYAEWHYGPQKWNMHHFNINLFSPTALYDEAKITMTYQLFEESRHDRRFGRSTLRNQREHVDLYTLNIDMDKSLGKNSLYYGMESTINKVNSEADISDIILGATTTTSSRYPNGGSDYNSIAGYATYKLRVQKQLTLNTGIRVSHVTLNGTSTDQEAQLLNFDKFDLANSAINGNIGLAYNPSQKTKVSMSLSTGFRSPNIDDVGKVFEIDDEDGSAIVVVPNPNLKPEYSYNAELGLNHSFHENIKFGIVGYTTLLDNAIVRGPITINNESTAIINGELSELRAQVNTSQAYIYGGSANVVFTLPHNLALSSSFTITKGLDKTNDTPLRHTTPNFGQTSLMYQKGRFKASLYAEYNGNRFREDIPSGEIDDKNYLYASHISDNSKDGSPGWVTLNLRTSYTINEHFSLTGALENISDTHYRPYSSGISAPGRNLIISLLGTL
jgi:hemoglobin/transferrin/lactoferrin receptor protein